MNINTIKTVSLLDVCGEVSKSTDFTYNEVWEEVSKSQYGNQWFSNDTYFIYALSSTNGEDLTSIESAIAKICKDVLDKDIIIFEVCW